MTKIENAPYKRDEAVVYVIGKITGDKNFKEKFSKAEKHLKSLGYTRVIIPTCVPDNLPYECYAPISIAFVQASDIVYALKDWNDSQGAIAELHYAEMAGKVIIFAD